VPASYGVCLAIPSVGQIKAFSNVAVPDCADFSDVDDYLNRKDVREKLGVPKGRQCGILLLP